MKIVSEATKSQGHPLKRTYRNDIPLAYWNSEEIGCFERKIETILFVLSGKSYDPHSGKPTSDA